MVTPSSTEQVCLVPENLRETGGPVGLGVQVRCPVERIELPLNQSWVFRQLEELAKRPDKDKKVSAKRCIFPRGLPVHSAHGHLKALIKYADGLF